MGTHLIYSGKKHLDKCGERIWWPGKPYFDTAFRRTFKTVEEKAHFMNSRNIVSTGDLNSKVAKERKEHETKKKDLKCRMV